MSVYQIKWEMGPKYIQIFCVLKSQCSFISLYIVLSYFPVLMYLFSRYLLGTFCVPCPVHTLTYFLMMKEELVHFAQ